MKVTSFGDLANSIQLRRETGRIKEDLARLTSELSSGIVSDLSSHLQGDYGQLAGLERGLVRADSYRAVIEEQKLFLNAQQAAFSKLREFGQISDVLLTLPDAAGQTLITNAGSEALANFSSALSTLNVQSGGRTVFSGTATNLPAVADAETILLDIEAEIVTAGATTATGIESVVVAWFDSGGGFDTVGYLGGPQATNSVALSDTETVQPLETGETQALRDHLAALSLGALLGRDVLAGDLPEQQELARLTGERLIMTNDQLVSKQAALGGKEAQIERASVEVSAQRMSLELARASLVEADPYDTAVKLQNSETQLQSIYAVTARLSRLSLVEYL